MGIVYRRNIKKSMLTQSKQHESIPASLHYQPSVGVGAGRIIRTNIEKENGK